MQGTLFDITGRVARVTGGSKGLGLAMARGFAEAGADGHLSLVDGEQSLGADDTGQQASED